MSASHQLTEQQRTKLLTGYQGLPSREMVRYWLLAEEDVRSINARRREYNRLGFAVQLCMLRYPGWPLQFQEADMALIVGRHQHHAAVGAHGDVAFEVQR